MAKKAIVVGAGIVGLASARALAVRGYEVTVIERSHKAVGASVRNFGMIWPVGQPDGELYERAMLSRGIWKQVCSEAGIWHDEVGSLHMAYATDELSVLHELATITAAHRHYRVLTPDETIAKCPAVVTDNLLGALWSPDEMIVDPRKALPAVAAWLEEKYGVEFLWGRMVTDVCYPAVYMGTQEVEADKIFICSGADFESLYPELFAAAPLTKCKLQMMRLGAPNNKERIGPSLCGALSLLHYKGFAAASSLAILRKRLEEEFPDCIQWGIHVMVSQNEAGELTVGDSHEYGLTHDPFDRQHINQLILDYLGRFVQFSNNKVIETWNGIYPKLTNGEAHFVTEPEEGVTIINGLGGAGMTLSFGLCEQYVGSVI
jgi:FAD dependent oxidoreductase TIGR03364